MAPPGGGRAGEGAARSGLLRSHFQLLAQVNAIPIQTPQTLADKLRHGKSGNPHVSTDLTQRDYATAWGNAPPASFGLSWRENQEWVLDGHEAKAKMHALSRYRQKVTPSHSPLIDRR